MPHAPIGSLIQALHDAARLYCMEGRADGGTVRLGTAQPLGMDDESVEAAGSVALDAFLREIEHTEPSDFPTLEAARQRLLAVGRTEEYCDSKLFLDAGDRAALPIVWPEERRRLMEDVVGLSEGDLGHIPPLPYRRFLRAEERQRIWTRLDQRWGISANAYWYPLVGAYARSGVLALFDTIFSERAEQDRLVQVFHQQGITRSYELHEGDSDPEYEVDLALWDWNPGPETYWTSRDADWVVYRSHEQSITFAGEWLVESVKSVWPDYSKQSRWQRFY